jgi:hypothetical protein
MIPFFSVTEADVQPGIVFLSNRPLGDGIKWGMAPIMLVGQNQSNGESHTGKRDIFERRRNGETLWMSTSTDGTLTKYTTTRRVDGDKISLAAYLSQKEEDNFTPAKIKFASLSSFKERVLSDAEDVACGLGIGIYSLLAVAFGDSAGPSNAYRKELLKERNW